MSHVIIRGKAQPLYLVTSSKFDFVKYAVFIGGALLLWFSFIGGGLKTSIGGIWSNKYIGAT